MNLNDIRLVLVCAEGINGSAFRPLEEGQGFEAKLGVEYANPIDDLGAGDTFDVRMTLEARVTGGDVFFRLSIIGEFQVIDPSVIESLKLPDVPYEVALLLYPYMRSVAKPNLEYLGASSSDFPFAPPRPPSRKQATRKAPARKKKTIT
jgi:hypothetical protein